jgi:hypothetical protein
MKTSLKTRLERLEKDAPVDETAGRIDQIYLVAMDGSVEPVLFWTRPGFVESASPTETSQ